MDVLVTKAFVWYSVSGPVLGSAAYLLHEIVQFTEFISVSLTGKWRWSSFYCTFARISSLAVVGITHTLLDEKQCS